MSYSTTLTPPLGSDPQTSPRLSYERVPEATNLALSESVDGVVTRSVSHSAVTNSAAYDAYRRAVVRTDGRGNATTNAYDALGRLASVTDPTGATTAYAYDAAGNIAAVTNALGVATVYEYDVRGNKTYEGGGTYPVTYAYDAFNVMTNMTTYRNAGGPGSVPASGDTTTWTYDVATGLLLAKMYADGHGPAYTYTDNGNLATRTWARGVVTYYVYDGWNRLLSCNYSDSTPSVIFVYDAMGRQQAVEDAVGVTSFSYDAFGDPSGEAVTGLYSKSMTRHRDAFGRDLGYTLDGSRKNIIEYETDTARTKRVMFASAWYTYGYLPGTDLKSSLTVGTAGRTDWTYEPARDLLTQVKNTAFGSVVSQYDYVNDAFGRRTEISRSGSRMTESRTDAYGYNSRNELTNAVKNAALNEYAYQYDDIGNRLSSLDLGEAREYTANELNQYTNIVEYVDDFAPQFDLDGNQTLIRTSTGIWSVAYNGENRPVSWSCGATNITMKYDRMGRRVEYLETEFTEEEVISDGMTNLVVTVTTNAHHRFVYDGYLCVQRLNAAANNTVDLAFGWDPTEPVATRPLWMQRVSGSYNFFYFHDGNKNVSELVSYQSARGVPAHYEYAPFGAVTAATTNTAFTAFNVADTNPYRFSSEYADDALGLVYYNYRHYDPCVGRWLNRDPIEEKGGLNLYAFCENDALVGFDALGRVTYSKLAANYPKPSDYPTDITMTNNIWQLIGGMVLYNAKTGQFKNSCAVRLSHSLNKSGETIPFIKDQTSSGKKRIQGKVTTNWWYIYRVSQMKTYLTQKYGKPTIYRKKEKFKKCSSKGILVLDINWSDATGHATLWDGKKTIDDSDRYFDEPNAIFNLWRFK